MILSKLEIEELVDCGAVEPGIRDNVGIVSYDLRTKCFYSHYEEIEKHELYPGDSVFVGSVECLDLPENLVARVLLRNRWIRRGLLLDAPLYFPGHQTRVFFRITNLGGDALELTIEDRFAQLVFEEISGGPQDYTGQYEKEFSFRGMGSFQLYESNLEKNEAIAKAVEEAQRKVEDSEQRMYANVLTLMSIIVAVLCIAQVSFTAKNVFELAIHITILCGAFSVFFGLSTMFIKENERFKILLPIPWALAVICIIATFVLFLITPSR